MNIYFIIIISLLLAQYLFKVVLELVNLLNITDKLPEIFADSYPAEEYKRSQQYLKENTRLDLVETTFVTILIFGMILSGGFNALDLFVRSFGYSEIITGLLYIGILFLAFELIQLPFDIYDTFFIEEKYGFNRMSFKTFFSDIIKQILISTIVGGVALATLLWFFEAAGPLAWLYCWIALSAYQLILTYIAPTWIMPLFNKFIPLPEGNLKNKIENYAKEVDFSLKGIYTMDGSKRSSKSNAFFTGFGKNRRIVLFDTLINKHSTDELVSILAHEVGHYKKKHIFKMLILSILSTGLMFFLLSLFINNRQLFMAFKMEHLSIYASFVFFSFLFTPLQILLGIIGNTLSRKYEYEADNFAVTTYKKPLDMIGALKKLSVDNLSNLTPHPWKVAISYSHPTVIQRIKAIEKEKVVQ